MQKNTILEITLGVILSVILFLMVFTGYPFLWFVPSGEFKKNTLPILYCAITGISISIIYLIIFKRIGWNKKVFEKYYLIILGGIVLHLLAYYISFHSDFDIQPSAFTVFVEGILSPVLRNIAFAFGVGILVTSLSKLPMGKYTKEISIGITLGITMLCTFVFFRNYITLILFYEASVVFAMTILMAYMTIEEENILAPAILIGGLAIYKIATCFTLDNPLSLVSTCIVAVPYLIMGSILIGFRLTRLVNHSE